MKIHLFVLYFLISVLIGFNYYLFSQFNAIKYSIRFINQHQDNYTNELVRINNLKIPNIK